MKADTPNRTGDIVTEAGVYRTLSCDCREFVTLASDDVFPKCDEHGDVEWEFVTRVWLTEPGLAPTTT